MNNKISTYLALCLFGIAGLFVENTVGRTAVVGGDRAAINEFPYQVSVQIQARHACGGGIIGEQFILTAGHCVIQKDGQFYGRRISVYAGRNDLRTTKNSQPALIVAVVKIYVPAEYKPPAESTTGDIAVLKLKQSFKLTPQIQHIKKLDLPRHERDDFNGKTAKIAGFGWDYADLDGKTETGGNNDSQLKFAEAIVLSSGQRGCPSDKVLPKKICAQIKPRDSEQRGVCTGDSGGPLVVDNTVVGILSTSPVGCTETVNGAIYTQVSYYLNFIQYAMKDKKSDDIRTFDLAS